MGIPEQLTLLLGGLDPLFAAVVLGCGLEILRVPQVFHLVQNPGYSFLCPLEGPLWKVGMYTDIVFVENDVRFIAVNDNVDSAVQTEFDMTPIRNFCNELYARDTAKKIKSTFKMKGDSETASGIRFMRKAITDRLCSAQSASSAEATPYPEQRVHRSCRQSLHHAPPESAQGVDILSDGKAGRLCAEGSAERALRLCRESRAESSPFMQTISTPCSTSQSINSSVA